MNGGTVQAWLGGWVVSSDWVIQGIGDFNGDGKADILWRQLSGGAVSIWQMNGGTLQASLGGWVMPNDWLIQGPSPQTVTLAWDENSTNETGFKVERSLDGSTNWTEIGTTSANATTYQDVGLAVSTTYYYRVRAFNSTGTSAYSSVVSVSTR
jgi:hypothetical protein